MSRMVKTSQIFKDIKKEISKVPIKRVKIAIEKQATGYRVQINDNVNLTLAKKELSRLLSARDKIVVDTFKRAIGGILNKHGLRFYVVRADFPSDNGITTKLVFFLRKRALRKSIHDTNLIVNRDHVIFEFENITILKEQNKVCRLYLFTQEAFKPLFYTVLFNIERDIDAQDKQKEVKHKLEQLRRLVDIALD